MSDPANAPGGVGPKRLRRRTFLKVGVVAGAGLTLGVWWKVSRGPGLPPTDATFAPNAYLRIGDDGSITVMVDRAEMGQGVSSALPQLLAEELDVAWEQVSFAFAPAHGAYGSAGMMVTGGSTSVVESWGPFRRAGATARWMLREAAARQWGIASADVETRDGMAIAPDGSTLSYGALASAAAALEVPDDVPLKGAADFRLIGAPLPRLDIPAKVAGEAVFGIDAGPTNARVAMIARPVVSTSTLPLFVVTLVNVRSSLVDPSNRAKASLTSRISPS